MSALWNLVKSEGPIIERPLFDRRGTHGLLFQRKAAGGMEHACVLRQVFSLGLARKRKRLPTTQGNLWGWSCKAIYSGEKLRADGEQVS